MDLKELEAIASREMMTHGLHNWTFGLADTKRRLGVCKYRTKRIEIAEYFRSPVFPSIALNYHLIYGRILSPDSPSPVKLQFSKILLS